MALNLHNHPCFNQSASHTHGRVHLPVAPSCNIQCNYCNRKYDCASENRPGVTSSVLSPGQAMTYLDQALERDPRIAVVGIAGPGDPFAEPDATMETLRRVRAKYPEMLLCVATNGLNLAPYVEELAQLEVSHVTITLNAVDPAIAGRIYARVRDGKRVLRGEEGVRTLLARQAEGIGLLKKHGILVKINTIVMSGINEDHVEEVARTVADLGADLLNVIPIHPVEGSAFETLTEPAAPVMNLLRDQAVTYLPQMRHCTRCRADAVGLLGDSLSPCQVELLRESARLPLEPEEERP